MATNQAELERRTELASFLRSRRARLLPEQVGLPKGIRRHTPGLRRNEVAMLAGITPEWYTRLEQGQDIRVSVQLLESLVRVLRLDAGERTHLFLLALRQPPPVESFALPSIGPTLRQFLNQLATTPACVVDPRLNILTWNAAYHAVFSDFMGDPLPTSERERNLIWRIFTLPVVDHGSEAWLDMARVCLAYFRAEYARFVDDPWWAEQIAELSRASPAFCELWTRHDVSSPSEAQKSIHHSRVGELSFDILLLQVVEADGLRVLLFTPRDGSQTAERIELLLASG